MAPQAVLGPCVLSQPGGSGGTISGGMVTGVVSQGPHQSSSQWAASAE